MLFIQQSIRSILVFGTVGAMLFAGPASAQVVDFLKSPLSFEPNVGQADSAVRYLAQGPGYAIKLDPVGASLFLGKRTVVRMRLDGAAPNATVIAEDKLPARSN